MSSSWDTAFLNIASVYREEWYKSDVDDFLKSLAIYRIKTHCLCVLYGIMVKHELIPPIESLDREEKQSIWGEAKRLFGYNESGYGSDDDEVIRKADDLAHIQRMCKAIYAMGQYVQL